jgi:hypothetical protein
MRKLDGDRPTCRLDALPPTRAGRKGDAVLATLRE